MHKLGPDMADRTSHAHTELALSHPATSLAERLLLLFCRKPGSEDYLKTTATYTLDNALEFARKTIPDFDGLVRNKLVLDYGCGHGWQAVAMQKAGARRVVGVDILDERLAHGEALARREGVGNHVEFHRLLPSHLSGTFDVVLSLSAFEHFGDPAAELQAMQAAARPGGAVVVSFAEPWLSPHGSHMGHFTNLPWVNVLFSEDTVMRVRARFRDDGATRYEDVRGGLNRMTLARFERIVRASGMTVESLAVHTVKGLPLVGRLPVLREYLTAAASCILRKT
jgi:2-polyprenyl-3-methyl-5-hydroxy-6-metoxy-1,4-benzoquinol methylase